jgi:hypothetical protein
MTGPTATIKMAASITSPTVVTASITRFKYTTMTNREDELLDQRHDAIMAAIEGVHARLDTLNGRTRTLENKVSVLSYAYTAGAAVLSFVVYKITGHQQ